MITIEQLTALGADFLANESDGRLEAENVFEMANRDSYVILSAPHATNTFVGGKRKKIDLFTGEIVSALGYDLNLSTIVRTKFVPQEAKISDFVIEKNLGGHFFLDIHAMSERREFDLAVGTGYFAAADYMRELDLIAALAEKYKIRFVVNHPAYCGKVGLTGHYQQHFNKPGVLQLEWRKDFRNYYAEPQKVLEQTVPFLSELALQLNSEKTQ